MQLNRRRIAGWTAAMVTGLLCGACIERRQTDDCVSVGGGWRACSAAMTTPGEAGTPDAGAAADASPRAPTQPTQRTGQAGSAGGRGVGTSTAGSTGTRPSGTGGTGGASGASEGADAAAEDASMAPSSDAGERPFTGADAGAGADAGGGGGSAATNAGTGGTAQPRAGAPAGSGPDAGSQSGSLPDTCCDSLGLCVEDVSLSTRQRALLGRDTCQADRELCAPIPVLDDPSFVPRTCRSVIRAEGRCLPECMSNLAAQAGRFPQDVCDTHEVCAPCFDPITGNATGACELGGDTGPRALPQRFTSCCAAEGLPLGTCVPDGYLSPGVTLPQADCAATFVCAPPTLMNDPTAKPTACTADIRGPGICVPQCIGDAVAPILTVQATCSSGDVCFPCTLVGGAATGVCPTDL